MKNKAALAKQPGFCTVERVDSAYYGKRSPIRDQHSDAHADPELQHSILQTAADYVVQRPKHPPVHLNMDQIAYSAMPIPIPMQSCEHCEADSAVNECRGAQDPERARQPVVDGLHDCCRGSRRKYVRANDVR